MQNSWSYLPVWAYPLVIFLVVLGISQCRARTVKVWRLFILPLVFILMSFNHLDGSPQINWLSGLSWVVCTGLGGYIGYLHKRSTDISIDRRNYTLRLPADWTMMVLIMLIFVVEFVINTVEAAGPATEWWFAPLTLGISGIITGMALGRNAVYLYRYFYDSK
ncbi:MAG: hypothetical protein Q7V63_02580 [Gammaproteobacteria bacterium]|nr:hypothetical protein [Gammaproteobacteria bacterium]